MKFNDLVNYAKSNSLFVSSPKTERTTSTAAFIFTKIDDGENK